MTDLATLEASWDRAAREDAMFNIITHADRVNGGWTEDEFFAHGREEIAAAMDHLGTLRLRKLGFSGRALDFGCGVGRLTEALADWFDRVDGVDVSWEMVKLAREYSKHDWVDYHANSKPDLSLFGDDRFDLVYSMITLQHMNYDLQRGYIAEFMRVLKPNGVAMFHIPDGPQVGHTGWHLSMYGVKPMVVRDWILKGHGKLVDVEDLGQDSQWQNYRYTVTR